MFLYCESKSTCMDLHSRSTYQVLICLALSLWQEMLKEKGVAPFSKWEKELPKIIFDLRFKVGEVIFVISAFLHVLHSSHCTLLRD